MGGVKICDTTLRDGEQAPGVVFGANEKIELAQKISDFGADIIDLMPVVSKTETMVAKELASRGLTAEISASCRLKKEDIENALDCGMSRIILFTPLSDIHLEHKLRISRTENIGRALEMIDLARSYGLKVDFAGEDTSRADHGYLMEFLGEIEGKIGIFFAADTLGCWTPFKAYLAISELKKDFRCQIGMHEHNDFGLATANTLAGINAGADAFSGTFLGLGERAGNAPIEEVCLGLAHLEGMELKVKFEKITELCTLVSAYGGMPIHRNKPMVGENAFSHESGIHADGVAKNPRTYEYFSPETIGQKSRFLFGKHTGRGILKHALTRNNRAVSEDMLESLLQKIKLASEEHRISFTEQEVVGLAYG